LSFTQAACWCCISRWASALISFSCSAAVRPSSEAGVPLLRQFPQARHADGVELVEVARADRHEAHPLQKRHAGVLGLLQHAPVEGEPAELAVEEPVRATGLRLGQDGRLGQRAFRKSAKLMGWA
jgi:hypothetical protein